MIFYIDASYSNINLALFDKNELISSKTIATNRNMSEIFVNEIKIFLKEINIDNNNFNSYINEIYLVNGPGSFTSIKLQSVFVNLIKSFFSEIQLYTIDSCTIQRTLDRCICVVDSRGNKMYAKIFLGNKKSKIIIANISDLNDFSKKYNIPLINTINNYDISCCFIANKDDFKNVDRIVPNYVKKAV